jgi:formate C-acetyltransferase
MSGDLQNMLEQVRKTARLARPFDRRKYWRAMAYRRHEGKPEALVCAYAFRNVLEKVPLHFYDGDKICGSRRGFCSPTPPCGVGESEFRALAAEHDARRRRDFTAGFDHTLADYPTLLNLGIDGLMTQAKRARLEHSEPHETAFLDAVFICLEAFAGFIRRHAAEAQRRGDGDLADCLRSVAGPPPATFRQAVQLLWLTHIAFVGEGRYAMALGRLDQYLLPFFVCDLETGRINREQALELLCRLWVHLAELGEISNICIGGLTCDGNDACNELSYMCLEATQRIKTPHANVSVRFHAGTSERFHRACFEVIRTGIGFPALFNDDVLLDGLTEIGIPLEIARDYCLVGCVETMLAGRQQAWSDSRFNLPQVLLKTLSRLSLHANTQESRHHERGWKAALNREKESLSFDDFLHVFRKVLSEHVARHAADINAHIARFPAEHFPDPFLSALTRDCIGRARDINDGGAEFPRFHGIAFMGLATTADSLAALKKLVFQERRISLELLAKALATDFKDHEPLRLLLENHAPKYGNDLPAVDAIARDLVAWSAKECLRHRTVDGGRFVALMAANIGNIAAGKETPATPDGRRAGTPLSDAASPFFGRDRKGPTAFLHSVAAPDYHRAVGGNVINMKFEPDFFRSESGAKCFAALTKFFVRRRIPELQFNFTGNAALLDARREPEKYRDLTVRVSGFSAYFVNLSPEVQEDVIRRRAHG